MTFLHQLFDALTHLDPRSIGDFASSLGPWFYVVLFAIIFAETGLVVTPFLPGDSLLFAVGAVAAHPESRLSLGLIAVLLVIAAVLGDAVNYAIGRALGPKVFSRPSSRLLNQKHLLRAHRFYEEHGGLTIVLARFVPIVRTFAPFVAGIGEMAYARFAAYNVAGGFAWITSFLMLGYWFGGLAKVQSNFHLVIGAIIIISVLPGVFEYLRVRSPRGAVQDPRGTAEARSEP